MIGLVIALKALAVIALSVFAGWSYRFGGAQKGIRWVRQVGCGIAEILAIIVLLGWSPWLVLIMGTIWATSTYFRIQNAKVNPNRELYWWNWLLVGLVMSLVPLPWLLGGHLIYWKGFLLRTGIVTTVETIVQTFFGGNVQFSEPFRGVIQIITLPLLMLFG